jgi:hypothetical protein
MGQSASRRKRPRVPKAFIASFVIVAAAVLALVGGGRIAALLTDIAVVAALFGSSKTNRLLFWRDAAAGYEEPVIETFPDMLPLIMLAVFRFVTVLLGIGGLILIMRIPLADLTKGSNPWALLAFRVADTVALAFVVYLGWIAIRFAIDNRLRQLAPLDPHGSPTENTRLLTLLPLLRRPWRSSSPRSSLFRPFGHWVFRSRRCWRERASSAWRSDSAHNSGARCDLWRLFLIEDIFRIGEYIESGSTTKGAVERISFRTVALRHHNGPLTFVPYGLLGTVRNDSRDWVIDKFNIPLPLWVDSEKIRRMIKGNRRGFGTRPATWPIDPRAIEK